MNSLVLLARPKCGLVMVASRAASAAAASNPVQRLFLDKVREFKAANKGLDEEHSRAMEDEMKRLKRVYNVDDENKLAHLDHKFPAECQVSLRDLDENREFRKSIASGEYAKQIETKHKPKSELLESIPPQVIEDMHLPPLNKPSIDLMLSNQGSLKPMRLGAQEPDYTSDLQPMSVDLLEREMRVRFGPDMPTIHDDQKPGRDAVNFPRIQQKLDTPPTRCHIIPESWFKFFYPKTGASGPYAFAFTFGTFLYSKEWLIYEHEMIGAFSSIAICTYAITKYGPKVTAWMMPRAQEEYDGWDHWQKGQIEFLKNVQEHYKNQLTKPELLDDIYQIRHQDVNMQVEHEHRNRIMAVHNDVKRRLNYLVAKADSIRQIAHKNMVNWVISNAISSFGPKQESEVLDSCILNLKQLASKNANAI